MADLTQADIAKANNPSLGVSYFLGSPASASSPSSESPVTGAAGDVTPFDPSALIQPGWQAKANQIIAEHNSLKHMQIKVVNSGTSTLLMGSTAAPAVLVFSTKDIVLTISGSKGGNAALGSLIAQLDTIFTIRDSTT